MLLATVPPQTTSVALSMNVTGLRLLVRFCPATSAAAGAALPPPPPPPPHFCADAGRFQSHRVAGCWCFSSRRQRAQCHHQRRPGLSLSPVAQDASAGGCAVVCQEEEKDEEEKDEELEDVVAETAAHQQRQSSTKLRTGNQGRSNSGWVGGAAGVVVP